MEDGVDRLELLAKFTTGISQVKLPDENALYDYLVRQGAGVLECHAATLFSIDKKNKTFRFLKSTGPVGTDLMGVSFPFSGIVGACATEKKAILVPYTSKSKFFSNNVDKLSGFKTKSVIAVPVIADNVLIGVVEYINKIEGTFTLEDLKIAKIMSDFISSCIVRLWVSQIRNNQ